MKCWCDEVYNYKCNDCKKEEAWLKVNPQDRVLLAQYASKLKNNTATEKDTMLILEKDLCPSQLPPSILKENV